jgi:hypothetical protein
MAVAEDVARENHSRFGTDSGARKGLARESGGLLSKVFFLARGFRNDARPRRGGSGKGRREIREKFGSSTDDGGHVRSCTRLRDKFGTKKI